MVFDPNRAKDLVRAYHLPQLFPFIRAMEACGHEDEDPLLRDPGAGQDINDWGKDDPIGDGPGDIAHEDAGALFAPGQFPKWRGFNGKFKSSPDLLQRIGEWDHGVFPNEPDMKVVWEIYGQAVSSIK
jgi:hypothetical protein